MRTSLLPAAAVLVLFAGCGTGRPPVAEPSPEAAGVPAPAQLAAALPQGDDVHGLKVSQACRDLGRACGEGDSPDDVFVSARTPKDGRLIMVLVQTAGTGQTWQSALEQCPRGRYTIPLKQVPNEDRYTPGQVGTAARTSYESGPWSGFRCEKTVRLTHPDDTTTRMPTEHWIRLRRGPAQLSFHGRSATEATTLATEYLSRLGQ